MSNLGNINDMRLSGLSGFDRLKKEAEQKELDEKRKKAMEELKIELEKQLQNQKENNYRYYGYMGSGCPCCNRCPHCGRSDYPYWYKRPNYCYPKIYC